MSTKENLGMTLQQLKYFITVAEIGNITYAAQRLYTSQPTISRQIQMLESELGYRLFNRHSKPLKLTEPGKILYDGMKEALLRLIIRWRQRRLLRKERAERFRLLFRQDITQNICFLRSLMN